MQWINSLMARKYTSTARCKSDEHAGGYISWKLWLPPFSQEDHLSLQVCLQFVRIALKPVRVQIVNVVPNHKL